MAPLQQKVSHPNRFALQAFEQLSPTTKRRGTSVGLDGTFYHRRGTGACIKWQHRSVPDLIVAPSGVYRITVACNR